MCQWPHCHKARIFRARWYSGGIGLRSSCASAARVLEPIRFGDPADRINHPHLGAARLDTWPGPTLAPNPENMCSRLESRGK